MQVLSQRGSKWTPIGAYRFEYLFNYLFEYLYRRWKTALNPKGYLPFSEKEPPHNSTFFILFLLLTYLGNVKPNCV